MFLGWETGGVGSMGMLSTSPAWHSVPRNYCAMHRVLAWGKMCRAGWLGVWGAHVWRCSSTVTRANPHTRRPANNPRHREVSIGGWFGGGSGGKGVGGVAMRTYATPT